MRAAIPFQPGLEQLTPGEAETQENLFSTIEKIENMTHKARGKASRGVHAKSIGLLKGTLRVHDKLPKALAQGLFAKPAEYPVTIRISTIPGDILSDAVSVPRGFALKVTGVEGALLPDARGVPVQDFLFASGKSFSAPTPHRFLQILQLLAMTTERITWLKIWLSRIMRAVQRMMSQLGHPVEALGILGGYPPTNPLGESFFTQAPLRYGDYVAKLGIFPESARFKALADIEIPVDDNQDALRNAVRSVMSQGGGSWTLRVQLRRDETLNPIEDASVPWPEDGNPYLPVATLIVPTQEGWSEALSQKIDEELSFSPWQGLLAHQPLGAIMRARRHVYPKAIALRGALNHRKIKGGKKIVKAANSSSRPASARATLETAAAALPSRRVPPGTSAKSEVLPAGASKEKISAKIPTSRSGKPGTSERKPKPSTPLKKPAKSARLRRATRARVSLSPLPKTAGTATERLVASPPASPRPAPFKRAGVAAKRVLTVITPPVGKSAARAPIAARPGKTDAHAAISGPNADALDRMRPSKEFPFPAPEKATRKSSIKSGRTSSATSTTLKQASTKARSSRTTSASTRRVTAKATKASASPSAPKVEARIAAKKSGQVRGKKPS